MGSRSIAGRHRRWSITCANEKPGHARVGRASIRCGYPESVFRTEEARAAVAYDVAIGINQRATRPVTAGAADRSSGAVSIGLIARLNHIGGTVRIRDRAADNGASENAEANRRAPAPELGV